MDFCALSATRKLAVIHSETSAAGKVVIDNEHWTAASKRLNGAAFKMYLYLAAQPDGSNYLMDATTLPQVLGFSFSSFATAIKELQTAGYLIQKDKHIYEYYTALHS